MEPQALNRYSRNRLADLTGECLQPATASVGAAIEPDHQILRAARERCQRWVRWDRRSMFLGLLLGPAAIVVACCAAEPSVRLLLVAAATLEICFVPWYTTLACRRLRYVIALIDVELEEGTLKAASAEAEGSSASGESSTTLTISAHGDQPTASFLPWPAKRRSSRRRPGPLGPGRGRSTRTIVELWSNT